MQEFQERTATAEIRLEDYVKQSSKAFIDVREAEQNTEKLQHHVQNTHCTL